jgi:hypothetical protein
LGSVVKGSVEVIMLVAGNRPPTVSIPKVSVIARSFARRPTPDRLD